MLPVYHSSDARGRKGIKSHPDRLLSFLPPAPPGISFLPDVCTCVCTSVMSIRLFVFLHVCMGFHVDVNLHVCMCVVCFNASATCGNLKLWGWNRLPCWGLFSVVPSFSAFFSPSASDSSNKLSRLGYSPQYKAVFPFFCSFSLVLSSLSFHKNDMFSPADTFL